MTTDILKVFIYSFVWSAIALLSIFRKRSAEGTTPPISMQQISATVAGGLWFSIVVTFRWSAFRYPIVVLLILLTVGGILARFGTSKLLAVLRS